MILAAYELGERTLWLAPVSFNTAARRPRWLAELEQRKTDQ
jgi:hypothetical protein